MTIRSLLLGLALLIPNGMAAESDDQVDVWMIASSVADGRGTEVAFDHDFRRGETFRLSFVVSMPGYAYLVSQIPGAAAQFVWPLDARPQAVEARKTYQTADFPYTPDPGETITLIFIPTPALRFVQADPSVIVVRDPPNQAKRFSVPYTTGPTVVEAVFPLK